MSTYERTLEDRATLLANIPAPSPGEGEPLVVASEHALCIAYGIAESEKEPGDHADGVALVTFELPRAHVWGAPNDEALAGHPLARRGLTHYGAFEIEPSSWLAKLIEINAVHPRHDAALFAGLRHFAITFQDSTFECIARSARCEVLAGAPARMFDRMKLRVVGR